MPNILAIDQGTSGTKAIVVDEAGRIRAIAEEPLRPAYLDGGGVEQDPTALLESVLTAGRRAAAEAAAAGFPPQAVALANQGETVLAWDRRTGRPLGPAIVWQDRRAEGVCAQRSASARRVAELTGLVLDPYFSAPKLRWLREQVTTDGVVTTTDTWLVHRLCGAFVTDAATASRSLLVGLDAFAAPVAPVAPHADPAPDPAPDPGPDSGSGADRGVDWDGELLDLFGLSGEDLPRIVPCDTVVGETDLFGGRLPVAGLIVDQQAALLAQSCLEPGTAKCTYGTGAFLLAQLGGVPVRSSAGLTTSVAWQLRGGTAFCVDGQVYTAASAVRWLVELGLLDAAERLDEVAAPAGDGVLCVPALAGLAAPWWDPAATASFSGMTLSSGPRQLVRAVLEGIAAQVAGLAGLIAADLGEPLVRLRVDGGLTRSRVLMQAQADLAQLPVDVYPSAHATAAGAAACARLALDRDLDLATAAGTWTPERVYEPAWSPDRAAEYLARWRRAAEATLAAAGSPGSPGTAGSGTATP